MRFEALFSVFERFLAFFSFWNTFLRILHFSGGVCGWGTSPTFPLTRPRFPLTRPGFPPTGPGFPPTGPGFPPTGARVSTDQARVSTDQARVSTDVSGLRLAGFRWFWSEATKTAIFSLLWVRTNENTGPGSQKHCSCCIRVCLCYYRLRHRLKCIGLHK